MDARAGTDFSVLFVCRANIIRSVIAECLVAQALQGAGEVSAGDDRRGSWFITSAGTEARPGAAPPERLQSILTRWNIDASQKRSRRLSAADVGRADLILTAERSHRSAVVSLEPCAVQRTFTIKQFGRLVDDQYVLKRGRQGGQDLIDHVRSRRDHVLAQSPEDDDIKDPVRATIRQLETCTRALATSLAVFGVSRDPFAPGTSDSQRWSLP